MTCKVRLTNTLEDFAEGLRLLMLANFFWRTEFVGFLLTPKIIA